MQNLLKNFPVVIEVPVAWGEMDAFGHVNNAVYFRYAESARVAYFQRLDLMSFMHETGIGPILGSISCRFRKIVTYPDTLSVGARVSEIKYDRFIIEAFIFSHHHQDIAAKSLGDVVLYHYGEKKKTTMPPEIRRRIEVIESENRK